MAKTTAQRQAEYRARHHHDVDGQLERLNLAILFTGKRQLERLAKHYGVTQRAILERLLQEAESSLLSRMSSAEQERYLD